MPLICCKLGLRQEVFKEGFLSWSWSFSSFVNVMFTKLKTCLCDNDTRIDIEQMPSQIPDSVLGIAAIRTCMDEYDPLLQSCCLSPYSLEMEVYLARNENPISSSLPVGLDSLGVA